MVLQGRPPLAWGTPLHEDTPHDTVRIIMQGLASPAGRHGPTMPAFADSFSDRQLADLVAYLRARYTDKPPWIDVAESIGAARLEKAREAAK